MAGPFDWLISQYGAPPLIGGQPAGPQMFDPQAQKRAMLMQALTAAGQAMSAAPNVGLGLAQGLGAAGQGALQGKEMYRQGAMQDFQIQQAQDEAQKKAERDKLWAQMFPTWGAPTSDMAKITVPGSTQYASAGGPTPDLSGAPKIGDNPMLAGMDQNQMQLLAMLGPEQGMPLLAEQAFAKPAEQWSPMSPEDEVAAFGRDLPGSYYASSLGNPPKRVEGSEPAAINIETINRGGMADQGYFAVPGDPTSWVSMGSAPRWQPEQGPKPPAGYTWGQGGGLEFIPGGPSDPATVATIRSSGTQSNQTDTQRLSAGFASRMQEANGQIADLEKTWQPTAVNSAINALPGSNFIVSAERQQFEQAKRNFINAQLRRESGAMISNEEMANADLQYFPQAGDGPEVLAQKKKNREMVIDAMITAAGTVSAPAGAAPPIPTFDPVSGQWSGL